MATILIILSGILTLLTIGLFASTVAKRAYAVITLFFLMIGEMAALIDGSFIHGLLIAIAAFTVATSHKLIKNIADDESNKNHCFEYYILIMFATVAAISIVNSMDFLSFYLSLELMTLSFYILVALRRTNINALEAGVKYFTLGIVSSAIMLFGISYIYGATGSLNFVEFSHQPLIMSLGIAIFMVGICFKLGLVPFHAWAPDLYEGAPTSVVMFISTLPKLAVFFFLSKIVHNIAVDQILLATGVLSLAWGSCAGLMQQNLKRLMAYSGIANLGFAAMALGFGGLEVVDGATFYLIIYLITNLIIFAAITTIASAKINDLAGLALSRPITSMVISIAMLSMAGIPPFLGFFAKFHLLSAMISHGGLYLAIYAIIMSVISCYYYLMIIKTIYFDKPSIINHTLEGGNISAFAIMIAGVLFLTFFSLFVI